MCDTAGRCPISRPRSSSAPPDVFRIGGFAPATTPRDVVQRLRDAMTRTLADPDVANAINAEPMPLTPQQFDEFIKRHIESNAEPVAAAGIPRN